MSDPEKKAAYDRYGKAGLGQGGGREDPFSDFGGFGGFSRGRGGFTFQQADDIFRNFFGGKDPFQDFFDDDPFMNSGFGGR